MQRLIQKIAGDRNQKQLKTFAPLVSAISALDAERDSLSDEEIKGKTQMLQAKIAAGASTDEVLVEAFTTVKQACKRMCGSTVTVKGHEQTRNMIPYDVQLLGGIILHKGFIAEMRTGEGKTLVATLPAYLNALTGKGVHVVTVNDYLASRDAEWMGHLYTRLGLTVGVVTKQTRQGVERAEAYAQDITYVENSELGFDYLRDNLTVDRDERTVTKRPLHFAIVDEVDSILIDEARTPMIISQASGEPTEKYTYYAQLVTLLTPAKGKKKVNKGFLKELLDDVKQVADEEEQEGDYRIDEKTKSVSLSSTGIKKLEELLHVENIYKELGYQEIHHIENALRAQAVYHIDKEYIIRDGEVMLVDDHTGRVMPGRRYSEGLHQAIEAKEKVTIQRESKTLATITYQHFFTLYEKLCGMTGTAMTEAEEFEKIYRLPVVQVPTHRPTIRVDKNDMVYFNQRAKWDAVLEYIAFYHRVGVPILIGTSSIETSEHVSSLLTKMALPHTVLNAKYHEQEANIVMNAGNIGSLVVATNMAGRGTDIKLAEGLSDHLAKEYARWVVAEAKKHHGLDLVIYSEREFDLFIDALSTELGVTPELIRQAERGDCPCGPGTLRVAFNTKKKTKEDAFAQVTLKVPEEKDRLERDIHFGLFILGTEKHDSRRIDNQLRGRSGRQGDPGVSQFFVAMDDEIMRKMGGDKIQSIAKMMLKQEDLEKIAFTQSQFTNSIQRAQKQMEGRHFGIRKHLFDYDSVIDKQRTRIYAKRDQITQKTPSAELVGPEQESLLDEITGFIPEIVHVLLHTYTASTPWMYTELVEELRQITSADFDEQHIRTYKRPHALEEYLIQVIQQILQAKITNADQTFVVDMCKRMYLRVLDKHWVEHIDEMHYLREKVGLYGYAQIDPLVMYKKEAFEKFQRLLFTIKKETLAQIIRFDFLGQQTTQENQQQLFVGNVPEEMFMMDMLKKVTQELSSFAPTSSPTTSPMSQQKHVQVAGQSAHVIDTSDDVEVIELDAPASPLSSERKSSKLRPNDKVNIQYPDGRIVYGVKRKKIKPEVDTGSVKVV